MCVLFERPFGPSTSSTAELSVDLRLRIEDICAIYQREVNFLPGTKCQNSRHLNIGEHAREHLMPLDHHALSAALVALVDV